jgi:hypothetical protein
MVDREEKQRVLEIDPSLDFGNQLVGLRATLVLPRHSSALSI